MGDPLLIDSSKLDELALLGEGGLLRLLKGDEVVRLCVLGTAVGEEVVRDDLSDVLEDVDVDNGSVSSELSSGSIPEKSSFYLGELQFC